MVVLRELYGHTVTFEVPAAGETDRMDLAKAGIQGGILTPFLFRSLTETALHDVMNLWQARGWGGKGRGGTLDAHLVGRQSILTRTL